MGATDEQMELVASSPMDHVSYILILYSLAFLMFLFAHMLIYLYERGSEPVDVIPDARDDEQLRDAEEFELDGLVSDEEDGGRRSKERGGSPRAIGSSAGRGE
ncbi:hypothetical protein IMZ48_23320 [Candidatus Bathyarchaeota archaeon]|nr:hypothetical protein [Candidatus Bathyarchaeota archaeon]